MFIDSRNNQPEMAAFGRITTNGRPQPPQIFRRFPFGYVFVVLCPKHAPQRGHATPLSTTRGTITLNCLALWSAVIPHTGAGGATATSPAASFPPLFFRFAMSVSLTIFAQFKGVFINVLHRASANKFKWRLNIFGTKRKIYALAFVQADNLQEVVSKAAFFLMRVARKRLNVPIGKGHWLPVRVKSSGAFKLDFANGLLCFRRIRRKRFVDSFAQFFLCRCFFRLVL